MTASESSSPLDLRKAAKQPLLLVLHDLDVRITGLDREGCHCGLVAEVALDAAMPVVLAALEEAQRREKQARKHALFCNEEATKVAEAQLVVIDQRDAARADAERIRQERDEARAALSIVEANFDEADAELERMRPVVEAAIEWKYAPMRITKGLPLMRAVDTYESQESTDGAS
jgi:hypothetical protein